MADVGVLNLQVKAASTDKATQRLSDLAGALRRVKKAVDGGIKLSPIGKQLENLAVKVDTYIGKGTIKKLDEIAQSLQKIKKASDIKIPNLSEFKKFQKYLHDIEQQNKATKASMGSVKTSMESVASGVSDATSALAEYTKAWRTVEQTYTTVRSKLGAGQRALRLGDGGVNPMNALSTYVSDSATWKPDWTHGENFSPDWVSAASRDIGDAIPVEGWIDLAQTIEQASDGLESVVNSVVNMRSNLEDVDNLAERFTQRMSQSNELIVNMGWQFGQAADEAERFVSEFLRIFKMTNSMRSSRALGPGGGGDPNGTAWTYYNPWGDVKETGWTYWKDGAIEVEGTVSDAMDTVNARIEGTKQLLLGAGEAVREVAQTAAAQTETASASSNFSEKTASAFDRVKLHLREAREYLRDFAWLLRQIPGTLGGMREGFSNLVKPIASVVHQFTRVAKYRAIRYAIKQITDGFSEGTENVYRYSKAIGSSFSMAMDDAASSLQTMRNSIGAAVAPLIQALIPVLQTVVRWFITVINYVNQFFALMRGQATWTHAVDATTSAYEDQTSAAQGASAAVKDLLADWDELNIIQSESGGGGGGGAASEAEDYLNMFEELATFDNRIKKIVDYIKDHAAEILDIVKAIGVAILGWKISKAFEGLLGDIGRLITGGALVYVSLKLGFASGFHAGQNGYFSEEDILGSILSDIAGLIGGYLLAGPAGAGVGLAVALTAQLIGYIEGAEDRKDMLKWGEGSLTPEEIEAYVTSLFAFDITARMHVLEGVIQDQETARTNLNRTIETFGDSLNDVVLGVTVDGSPQGIIKAGKAAKELIDQINKNLRTSEKNIEVLTKIKPLGNEDETGSILNGLKIADKTMSEYFTGIGEEIAHWIDEGQKSGWKNNEAQMALELMEHQQNILEQAEHNKIHRDFQVDSEINLAGLSRGTVEKVFDKEVEMINQYEEKYRTALENQAKELFYYADLADAAGLKDGEGNPLGNVYRSAADGLLEQIKSGKYMEELQPTLDLMRTQWIEALKKVYGEDVSKHVKVEALTHMDFGIFGKTTPRLEQVIGDSYRKALFDLEHGGTAGGMQLVKNALEEELWKAFDTIDPDGIARKAAKNFNISIFDLLGEDALSHLVQSTLNAVNNDTNAAYQILSSLGIDSAKIAEAMKLSILEGTKEGAAEAQDAAEQYLPDNYKGNVDLLKRKVIPTDLLNKAGWDAGAGGEWATVFTSTFSGQDFEIQGPQAKTVIGITPILDDGTVLSPEELDSYVVELFEEAQRTGQTINEIDAGKKKLVLEVDTAGANETVEDAIERVNQKMQEIHDSQEKFYSSTNEGKGWFDSLFDSIFGSAKADEPEIEYAVEVVEDPSVHEPISAPGVDNTEFNRTINERVETARQAAIQIQDYLSMMGGFAPMTGPMSGYRESARPVLGRAAGGAVRSGDLVMANENGNFEMMGRMGHQPVVANNQQIVDGISRGVTNANGNVVTEMRTMVTLMQRLLNKEIVAKAVPSSGWGRNNSKSAEAYSKVTG